MSRSRAFRSGLRSVLADPALYLAELTWRWIAGLVGWMAVTYAILLFLRSLPVTTEDLFGLSGIIPQLIPRALEHIFRGSGPTLLRVGLAVVFSLSLLWWIASSFGRFATLRALGGRGSILPVLRLNLFRVWLAGCAWLAYLGAFLLARSMASVPGRFGAEFDTGRFYLFFLPLIFLIGMARSTLGWYLTLAPVCAVMKRLNTAPAIVEAVRLAREQASQFSWVGLVLWVANTAVGVCFLIAYFWTLGLIAETPSGTGWLLLFFFTAASSAINAFLSVVRTAGYVRIVEWEQGLRFVPARAA